MTTPTNVRPSRTTLSRQLAAAAREDGNYAAVYRTAILATLPAAGMDDDDHAFVHWLAGWDDHTVAGLLRLLMLLQPAGCDHPAVPPVEVDADHWMGRLAFHLELLLRHADTLHVDVDAHPHRSVAAEMARACLDDYQTLRAQQTLAADLADLDCRPCQIEVG